MTAIERQRIIFSSFSSDFGCQPAGSLPDCLAASRSASCQSSQATGKPRQPLARYFQITFHFLFFVHGYGPEPYNAHSHMFVYYCTGRTYYKAALSL